MGGHSLRDGVWSSGQVLVGRGMGIRFWMTVSLSALTPSYFGGGHVPKLSIVNWSVRDIPKWNIDPVPMSQLGKAG